MQDVDSLCTHNPYEEAAILHHIRRRHQRVPKRVWYLQRVSTSKMIMRWSMIITSAITLVGISGRITSMSVHRTLGPTTVATRSIVPWRQITYQR